jgi:putative SOS response-associated peptidase YedK
MCGRYTLHTEKEVLARRFALDPGSLDALGDWQPRYNIAPSQPVLALVERDGRRSPRWLRWGLIPHWSPPAAEPAGWINARAETAATRPAFRDAFARRRCLILADGFYEWQAALGASRRKTPHWIARRDGQPFAMAGLWSRWRPLDREPVASCAIVTTPANAAVRALHDRMPAILRPGAEAPWLSSALDGKLAELAALLEPIGAEELFARPVSIAVNSTDNEGPALIEPAAEPQLGLFSER